jgi:ribonuclease P protein component
MKPEGFPRNERLRARQEFSRTLQQGARVEGDLVLAYWISDDGRSDGAAPRVGIAAGKRLGGAAVRNRLKRRLREAYRKRKSEFSWKNISIVLVARSRSLRSTSKEIEADVADLLARIEKAVRSSHE